MLVKGGPAGSGTKRGKQPAQREAWTCAFGHQNRSYHATCMANGCREKRPQ